MEENNESMTTERIWNLLSTRLRRFLLQQVSDEQVAEDLLQETFIRIHQKLDDIDDIQRLTPWVFRIARNLVVDHYRSKSRNATAMTDDVEALNDDVEHLNELVAGWLPQMISQLPDPYREAVELYELKGVPQQEIADQLPMQIPFFAASHKGPSRQKERRKKELILQLATCDLSRQ